ncbi:gamma-glutamylcyclotransferase family protein [cf. Phormidesmis sp. LEGE 11477]|uniref:gamma-glutamylcyclotransferase family protein n=1 Tax=cf. Phormidesmis sp. LEGE 11477 TaxID=1828680 RepID=UPI0018810AC8|nr:gamma-glutamylcyclotransferase family protein [cf. Phormidesmis sp. LEGE 11477]MBE9063836.1 gamma-glutamylcyclotransferase [cf. Phormidesmis sp. LEGE 11477]
MTTIIVYGSLINLEQRQKQPNLSAEACPVLVKGYKRVFNQEPSWRKGSGEHRAVLNVVRSEHDCLNSLLVKLHEKSDLGRLDERERGYDRIAIAPSQIAYLSAAHPVYPPARSSPTHQQTYLYLGKPEKQNNNILPNENYLEICLDGAKQWGEIFYEQFLQTTYVGEQTLKTFLRDRP